MNTAKHKRERKQIAEMIEEFGRVEFKFEGKCALCTPQHWRARSCVGVISRAVANGLNHCRQANIEVRLLQYTHKCRVEFDHAFAAYVGKKPINAVERYKERTKIWMEQRKRRRAMQ